VFEREWIFIWNEFKKTDTDGNYRLDKKEFRSSELKNLFNSNEYGKKADEKFDKIDRNRSGSLTADEVLWERTKRISENLKGQPAVTKIPTPRVKPEPINIKPLMSTEDFIKMRLLEAENKKLQSNIWLNKGLDDDVTALREEIRALHNEKEGLRQN
jgi:hypothetical protein